MKKLIIAAAVVAVGVSAFASTVTWSGKVTALSGVTSGYQCFLVAAENYATAADAVAALMDGTAGADVWYQKAGMYSSGSSTVNITGITGKAMTGDGTKAHGEQFVDFYSIILDGTAKNGDTDGTATHYFSMTGSEPTKFQASNADLFTINLGDKSSASTWTNIGADTPEPTSGLLLLLGVAGLALKRKRA